MKKISWLFNGRLLDDALQPNHQKEHHNHQIKNHKIGNQIEHQKTEYESEDQTKIIDQNKDHIKHLTKKHQTKHRINQQTAYQNENQNKLIYSNRTSKQRMKQRSKKELINEQYIDRITFRNEDHSLMSISSANRLHNGKYECLATNSIGTTHSEPVLLDIKCE